MLFAGDSTTYTLANGFTVIAAPVIQVLDGTTAISEGGSDSFGTAVAGAR